MSTIHRRTKTTALVAAVALAALPTGAHAADGPDPLRLDTGHVDLFNLALNDDDSVRLNLKEDVTGHHVEHAPQDVQIVVKERARVTDVPAGSAPPGLPTSFYHLPIAQDRDLVWPGWDSMGLASRFGPDADVDLKVSAVDGPGDVYLWSNGAFGALTQTVTDSWTLPGTIHQDFLAHVHANWAFTAPGVYHLTAQATVTSQDGATSATSNTATYTFVVGDQGSGGEGGGEGGGQEPGPGATTTVVIDGVPQHYHTGEVAILRAEQSPTPASDRLRWSTRPTADAPWTVVEGASSGTYGFVITGPQEVKVAVLGDGDAVVAESAPVAILVDDHGATPVTGPELEVTLPSNEGALVVSVAPDGRKAKLSDLALSPTADRYVSDGSVTGITVADTRPDKPGWAATGRVRALVTSGGGYLDGRYLGWTPKVVSSSGATVTPGAPVAPGFTGGNLGIRGWSALASAPQGASLGTSVLGADLRIEAPLTIAPGAYTGLMLLTVI
ncbi:choice-of-anchor M domain-containing protein [Xylanimonas ulmi]|uniref:Surface-anchored protein n=1 Tax=Xylanimonas ulmi TaxID=228973 RepID=A0A4Q7M1R4_9MICO|nr:choice-of-anchor M domain-containing protein [Xylanibacterium ulmi]RZS60522.1 surface-anchored protein [Xylanibacterium ulmi]